MIRPVRLDDAKCITDIYNHYVLNTTVTFETAALSVEDMAKRIETISAHWPYFVYEEEGEIMGYCYVHPWKERAAYAHTWEVTIYLKPGALHHHAGTAMMEHLIETCRKTDCRALIACITEENTTSLSFHGKMGFKKVSHFKEVGQKFGRWLDVTDMELLLE
ncbi:MAG: N-acetyltransferase family protein [Prevotella sp.]|nr:N-acetyltransferase family protein [Prevotella sp.]MDD7046728.1 GNAT family N-acetyltransferase [Prevotella sp.]MDY5547042.1 N-acetyltransferase family protein [Prevotella sp.]